MQLATEIYISISYVQGTGDTDKAQAKKISIKKAQANAQATWFTDQCTGDKVLARFCKEHGTWILLEITFYYSSL